eukprot:GHVN01015150.1.p1 GENE.GHVN01015150.1~~GHVN01015150.1.p1  ORF type:complete len:347 (+),score=67.30 GHVN01015150.1:1267-2307(+)
MQGAVKQSLTPSFGDKTSRGTLPGSSRGRSSDQYDGANACSQEVCMRVPPHTLFTSPHRTLFHLSLVGSQLLFDSTKRRWVSSLPPPIEVVSVTPPPCPPPPTSPYSQSAVPPLTVCVGLSTSVAFLHSSYSFVFVLDVSPSLNSIDTSFSRPKGYSGSYLLDSLLPCLICALELLVQPMRGGATSSPSSREGEFERLAEIGEMSEDISPLIFITVIAQSASVAPPATLVQNYRLTHCSLPLLKRALSIQLGEAIADVCQKTREKKARLKVKEGDSMWTGSSLTGLIDGAFQSLSQMPPRSLPSLVLITDGVIDLPRFTGFDNNPLMNLNLMNLTLHIIQVIEEAL